MLGPHFLLEISDHALELRGAKAGSQESFGQSLFEQFEVAPARRSAKLQQQRAGRSPDALGLNLPEQPAFLALCPNNSTWRQSAASLYAQSLQSSRRCPAAMLPEFDQQQDSTRGKVSPPQRAFGHSQSHSRPGPSLARLVYRMLRYGRHYVEKGMAEYEIRSDFNASSGLNARQSHSTCNSFRLNHQRRWFLKSCVPVW